MCRPIWCCRQEGEHGESGARPDSGLVSDSSSVNDVLRCVQLFPHWTDIYIYLPWWSVMINYACFFCKMYFNYSPGDSQKFRSDLWNWDSGLGGVAVFPGESTAVPASGEVAGAMFFARALDMVDWGDLINQWLEQIWWVHLPHMLVAKSFPNPLIDWCWCGSHVVPRSQMIGTPQGLSKSCLSTDLAFDNVILPQDRPCHEHTGSSSSCRWLVAPRGILWIDQKNNSL